MISHTVLNKTTRNDSLHVRHDIGNVPLKVVASISGKKRTPEENDALVDEALAFALRTPANALVAHATTPVLF